MTQGPSVLRTWFPRVRGSEGPSFGCQCVFQVPEPRVWRGCFSIVDGRCMSPCSDLWSASGHRWRDPRQRICAYFHVNDRFEGLAVAPTFLFPVCGNPRPRMYTGGLVRCRVVVFVGLPRCVTRTQRPRNRPRARMIVFLAIHFCSNLMLFCVFYS